MDPAEPDTIQTETSEMDAQLLASRNQLKESHERLIGVSQYCESEYMSNKEDSYNAKAQLEKTKQYTTQSLASVAYQINTLATTFLSILQMQTAQLNMLETSINQVGQKVDLYQEKVARRDIGKLANKRSTHRSICVRKVHPNEIKNNVDYSARPHRYIRRGIDFNTLDMAGTGSYSKMKNSRLMSGRMNNPSGPSMSGPHSTNSGGHGQPAHSYTSGLPSHSGMSVSGLSTGPGPGPSLASTGQNPHVRQPSSSHSGGSTSAAISAQIQGLQGLPAAPPGSAMYNQFPAGYGTLGKNVKVPDVGPSSHTSNTMGTSHATMSSNRSAGGPRQVHNSSVSMASKVSGSGASQTTNANTTQGSVNNNPRQLKPLTDEIPSPPGPAPPVPPPMALMQNTQTHTQNLAADNLQAEHNRGQQTTWMPPHFIDKVKVIYDYQPDQEDELNLTEGETIYVIVKNEDGWWEGFKSENCSGLFPSNYVASVQEG